MFNVRKVMLLIMAAALLIGTVTVVSGCDSGPVITIYSYGEYIDEDVLESFKEETGITVKNPVYSESEEMYVKVTADPSSYDIIILSDHMISKLISEDYLAKLDFANIPEYKNVDERFKGLMYDPADEYSVPYMWGTTGILYNTTMVDEEVDSWDILWDEAYTKQIFMYRNMRDIIAVAQKRLGFSLNDTNIDNLNQVKAALFEQKPLVTYVGEVIRDNMIGEEGALAMVYSGDALYCIEENDDLEYVVPYEGSTVWYDAMVILKESKNKKEAEMFIDYLCRPDIALLNTEYGGYSTPNAEAFKLLPDEWKNSLVYWPSDEILGRCEVMIDLGDFTQEYEKAWTEILAAR